MEESWIQGRKLFMHRLFQEVLKEDDHLDKIVCRPRGFGEALGV